MLHPFGAGNPEPVVAARTVTVLDARLVGDGHLKLAGRQPGSMPLEAIGFRMGAFLDRAVSGRPVVDLAFVPELTHWRGYDRIELRLRDIRTPARR